MSPPVEREHAQAEIVATLGPASLHLTSQLLTAGATTLRLNASHMSPDELARAMAEVRRRTPSVPVVVDLQGAKVRLGRFEPKEVRPGDPLVFSLHPQGQDIPLPHAEVFDAARPGDTLSSDDSRLKFRVNSVSRATLEATVLDGGVLRPRKGFNVIEHPVRLHELTPADRRAVEAVAGTGDLRFALSFMQDGREASWIRRWAPGCPVIGKIERQEAVDSISSIASAVDSLWICRGDLGAQLGLRRMAEWIRSFDPATSPVRVLMAGQVLEHLTRHAEPTRAEACQVVDLLWRGYAGFVLSDETAIGVDPVRAVRALRDLCTPGS